VVLVAAAMTTKLLVSEDNKDYAFCYRCDGRSDVIIHDERGCKYACKRCRAWRESFVAHNGHSKDCPTGGSLTKEKPHDGP
jgi:hypothetical protein